MEFRIDFVVNGVTTSKMYNKQFLIMLTLWYKHFKSYFEENPNAESITLIDVTEEQFNAICNGCMCVINGRTLSDENIFSFKQEDKYMKQMETLKCIFINPS